MAHTKDVAIKLARTAGVAHSGLRERVGDSGRELAVAPDETTVTIDAHNYVRQIGGGVAIIPGTTPEVHFAGSISATETYTNFSAYPSGHYPLTATYLSNLSASTGRPNGRYGTAANTSITYGVIYRDIVSGMWGPAVDQVTVPPVADSTGGYAISYPPSPLPNGYVDAYVASLVGGVWRFQGNMAPYAVAQFPPGLTHNSVIDAGSAGLDPDTGMDWSFGSTFEIGKLELIGTGSNISAVIGGDVTVSLPGVGTATTGKKQGVIRLYATPHGASTPQFPLFLDVLADGTAGSTARLGFTRSWTMPHPLDIAGLFDGTSVDFYLISDVVPYNYDVTIYIIPSLIEPVPPALGPGTAILGGATLGTLILGADA